MRRWHNIRKNCLLEFLYINKLEEKGIWSFLGTQKKPLEKYLTLFKINIFCKIILEENFHFLKCTTNLHKCEMLEAAPLKSGPKQICMIPSLWFKHEWEYKTRAIKILK
jgi:hypothetical protein